MNQKATSELARALGSTGPDALGPLKSVGNTEVYYAVLDGQPILCRGEWSAESSFSSREAAVEFATQFSEHLKSKE